MLLSNKDCVLLPPDHFPSKIHGREFKATLVFPPHLQATWLEPQMCHSAAVMLLMGEGSLPLVLPSPVNYLRSKTDGTGDWRDGSWVCQLAAADEKQDKETVCAHRGGSDGVFVVNHILTLHIIL